ncbi:LLM class flavin-dependent oxidoreductase [Sphingomonas sp. YL-JM2C]
MLGLMTVPNSIGGVMGAWRHPDAWPDDRIMNLDHYISIAKTAERGKFDCLFVADGNGVRQIGNPELFQALSPLDRPANFEPLTLYAALSQHTRHIGFVSTATTTYEEPYILARKFASLDHISKGRAAWNIVTTADPEESRNFGREQHLAPAERYPRAMEFVDVVKGLWDSWADDAFVQNRETGQFLDASRVHVLNHEGEYLKVRGPLNVARPIQGHPILFTAGQSEAGRELAAKYADCLFAVAMTKADGIALRNDVRERLGKYGRPSDALKVFPAISVYVGETAEAAEKLYQEVGDCIPAHLGIKYLEKTLVTDLSGYDLDAPFPDLELTEVVGINSIRQEMARHFKEKNLTIRQAFQSTMRVTGGACFKGAPTQVADEIEDWYRSGACDGFLIAPPIVPTVLEDFVDLVVPELQRRGIFRTEYTGRTLRENLGLPMPRNQFFGASA